MRQMCVTDVCVLVFVCVCDRMCAYLCVTGVCLCETGVCVCDRCVCVCLTCV